MSANDTTKNTMNALRTLGARPWKRGFTLVELMIAMALVGMLTALIYGLFVRTSDSLTEVENLAGALDQARFGIDHVRTDLQGAGAQMTSNAENDVWFAPNDGRTVHGVMGYDEWQSGSDRIYGSDGDITELGTENPHSEFSGIVVLGSYTVPSSFYVSFPQGETGDALDHQADDGSTTLVVESTERGLHRFTGFDPFDTSVREGVWVGVRDDDEGDTPHTDFLNALVKITEDSLLRVTDGSGFSQVKPVTGASFHERAADEAGSGAGRLHTGPAANQDSHELDLEIADLHFIQSEDSTLGDEQAGFDPYVEDDVSYNAALIDAFWYYVRPAPDDERNLQLVRHRVDAGELIDNAGGLDFDDLEGWTDGNTPMIIAENVVDFRVWFSCAASSDEVFGNAAWSDEWEPDFTNDCIGDDPGAANPQRARFAHARLSTRTERENTNRPHYTVEAGWPGFETPGDQGGRMRTYNVVPHSDGSARVVTTQASVELTNFAMRNVSD